MGNIGPGELLIIALIALLLFGAGRLADIGKGLGQGIKNFKAGLKDEDKKDEVAPAADADKKSDEKKPEKKDEKKEEKKDDEAKKAPPPAEEDESDDEEKKVRVEGKA